MKNETELVEYIYSNFVDKNQVLLDATERGYLIAVEFCIDSGANDFNRALSLAAENGHLHIIKFLVKKMGKYLDLDLALGCAEKKEHLNIVEFLKKEIEKMEEK